MERPLGQATHTKNRLRQQFDGKVFWPRDTYPGQTQRTPLERNGLLVKRHIPRTGSANIRWKGLSAKGHIPRTGSENSKM